MLKINYASDMSNKEKMDNLFNAIHYESNTMMIAVNNDAIAICDKKIENKSGKFTEIQIEAEKAKKADLEKSNRKLKGENGTLYANWESVIAAISGTSKEFEKDGEKTVATNDETAVRNVLRLTACADNRKFFSYAILTECDNFAQIYDNFYALHKIDDDAFESCGKRKYNDNNDQTFKTIEREIQALIKKMFSISIENEYTKKVNVKFNATDMGALHECYTSGISAMVSFSKKAGTTEFNGYNCKFAITRKESKDGTVSYDGRKFMNLLATIAFQYICG